jgi:hypothetical protein
VGKEKSLCRELHTHRKIESRIIDEDEERWGITLAESFGHKE